MISPGFALPEDSQRLSLNDELHARPPVRLAGAQHVVYLAVRHGPTERDAHRQALARLPTGPPMGAHPVLRTKKKAQFALSRDAPQSPMASASSAAGGAFALEWRSSARNQPR